MRRTILIATVFATGLALGLVLRPTRAAHATTPPRGAVPVPVERFADSVQVFGADGTPRHYRPTRVSIAGKFHEFAPGHETARVELAGGQVTLWCADE